MSENNPWTTLSTRVVYANPWITVREDQVIRPDGQAGIYGVVEARVATGVVAMTPAREIVLVGQFRYTLNEYSWEIVEGGAEPGEAPIEAARRELREEAGLVAEHWEPLGGIVSLTNCHSNERGYLFLATGLRQVGAEPEGTEQLQIRTVAYGDVMRMLDTGEITDGLSVMALLRLDRMLRAAG